MISPERSVAARQVPGCGIGKARRLTQLSEAGRPELQDAWLETFGRRPPVRLSRELLVLALSYQVQSERNGGLDDTERQELGITSSEWIAGVSHGNAKRPPATSPVPSDPLGHPTQQQNAAADGSPFKKRPSPRPVRRSIKPGTRLLREWQGQTHEVIAESTGNFLYRGEAYRSLSAIARDITGTRWSGPTFFGIASKNQAQKAGGGDDA